MIATIKSTSSKIEDEIKRIYDYTDPVHLLNYNFNKFLNDIKNNNTLSDIKDLEVTCENLKYYGDDYYIKSIYELRSSVWIKVNRIKLLKKIRKEKLLNIYESIM
jgi:uncharacterized radical SAM superfamily protein